MRVKTIPRPRRSAAIVLWFAKTPSDSSLTISFWGGVFRNNKLKRLAPDFIPTLGTDPLFGSLRLRTPVKGQMVISIFHESVLSRTRTKYRPTQRRGACRADLPPCKRDSSPQ